jgi:hypothetical protein
MQNFYIKKKKTKHKTSKLIANQYLNNICLNDSFNDKLFAENIETNKYKIFLYLNTIKSNKIDQTDYFNCYKEKLIVENSEKNKLLDFIQNEFSSSTSSSSNDASLLSLENNNNKSVKSGPKILNNDVEFEYLESIRRKNEQEFKLFNKQSSTKRNLSSASTASTKKQNYNKSFKDSSNNSTSTKYVYYLCKPTLSILTKCGKAVIIFFMF